VGGACDKLGPCQMQSGTNPHQHGGPVVRLGGLRPEAHVARGAGDTCAMT
jgi:hypothetical protein